ncbi:hypothetical protein BACIH_2824 [Bacillus amyloliquefaciens]|nr:hypothetical protein U471_28480 [Bacillus amyloliquefaciens CC178]QEY90732.1 hypothetical protein BACIT_2872 [Bacillus amyloliquefaciens]QEY94531.1 hypothetical protein BACIH_2824 [Bacillus amyloliquefaciens]
MSILLKIAFFYSYKKASAYAEAPQLVLQGGLNDLFIV